MTPEIQDAVIEHLANGDGFDDFCGKDGIPSHDTIWRFWRNNEAFAVRCARARAMSAFAIEQEHRRVGQRTLDREIPADVCRAVQNGLQWQAKVRGPKTHGDKLELDAKVSVGDAVIERLARARGEKEAA
jgi:hypothetical protein